ncbi:MAG: hypothetical protein HRT68_16405, partial [Flavobacteriaceae bacterium]|nr:hypothetical protein [Flavobacteriaceae bacterium]
MLETTSLIGLIFGSIVFIGLLIWIISMYKKVIQGKVLVRTGAGGTQVYFSAGMVVPV